MTATVRPLTVDDVDTVVELSLRAWAPVFDSFRAVMGERVFHAVYPDWLRSQADAVRGVCQDQAAEVFVAQAQERPVGFVAVVLRTEGAARSGEVEMLAVDPEHQGRGVGTALTDFAVGRIRAAGCTLAQVMTGGDPGHAPARRTYEKAGFTALPLVRYYRALG